MDANAIRDRTESLCSSPDQYQHEELDPRVKDELDRLNGATDEINKLETALEEANNSFRHDLSESSSSLQQLGRKLGSAVEKARPYFEAMQHARKLHLDCQRTAVQYQRANAVHANARATIAMAEDRFSNALSQRPFDPAWQEMLNHATRKVLEAEAGRRASEREHEKRAAAFTAAQQRVSLLGRQLKSSIEKARPYFDQKELFDAQMEQMSQRVEQLQQAVAKAKLSYAHALNNLEQISEEIHEQRRYSVVENLKREPGVGAEDQPLQESDITSEFEAKECTRTGYVASDRSSDAANRHQSSFTAQPTNVTNSGVRQSSSVVKSDELACNSDVASDISMTTRECGSGDEFPSAPDSVSSFAASSGGGNTQACSNSQVRSFSAAPNAEKCQLKSKEDSTQGVPVEEVDSVRNTSMIFSQKLSLKTFSNEDSFEKNAEGYQSNVFGEVRNCESPEKPVGQIINKVAGNQTTVGTGESEPDEASETVSANSKLSISSSAEVVGSSHGGS